MPKTSSSAKKHSATGHKSNAKNPLAIMAISLAVGTALLLGSAALFSFLLKGNSSPESFFSAASLLCSLIAGCGAGIAAAVYSGNSMPYSVISGILLLLMFLAISAAFDATQVDSDTGFKAIIVAVTVVSSAVAGALSARKKGKKSKSRR